MLKFSRPSAGYFPRLGLSLVLLSLLCAGLCLALLSPAPGAAQAQALGSTIGNGADSPFGMNVGSISRYTASGTGDDYSRPMTPAKNAGVSWDREEIRWDVVEPRPGQWDWRWTDKGVNAAVSRGIQVLGVLQYNVDRSAGNARVSFTMPDLNAWRNYVAQVVTHYKDRVKYWQIWNEPMDNTYFVGHDPVQYGHLLATSYDTIKAIDPAAKVLTAGFDPPAQDWMQQAFDAGGARDKFDIIAVHPYVNSPYVPGGSLSPESVYWVNTYPNLATGFAARNGNKPVWATEFGWSTENTDGKPIKVTPEEQANYLTRASIMGLSSGIQKFFPYQFADDAHNPTDRYGMIGLDWSTPKPAYNAYRNMVTRLSGAAPQGRFDPYEGTSANTVLWNFENAGGGTACGPNSGNSGYWGCWASSFANVTMQISGENAHSGQALKVSYSFGSGTNDRYVSLIPPALPQLGFNPTKLGFWAYGDANMTELRFLVRDSAGQMLFYNVGRMGAPWDGWQRYEAQLGRPVFPQGNVSIAYPIKSIELILDGWPKATSYSGTAYFDDLYAENSPPVYDYRFTKNGKTLDAVWADGVNTTVGLATTSTQATVYNRDGSASTINASNGMLNLPVGPAPIYVEHVAAATATPPASNPSGSCQGAGQAGLRSRFNPTWDRYDDAVASGRVKRSWMWGPTSYRFVQEPYDEAPGGCRTVLYWDKSRMEITNPGGNPADKYYVTNGLLARELVSGQIQVGNNRVVPAPQGAAQIPAAGDQNNNPNTPTYAAFARVTTLNNDHLADNRTGATVIETIDRNGNTGTNGSLGGYNVTLANYATVTHHNIANVFWSFMNSRGPVKVNGQYQDGDAVDWIYSIGLPLSEPYWARVTVGGKEKDVLIQVFERRVLTYTPSNPAGFTVEMGNIGTHYAVWRYGQS
ncbi:MAG TPA: endo-1,4-beta-xylanase [Chloroflexia bacterium]|nr:endo-1,4-beta-xylanase [Chloroflexia bacterium]